ncbi:putative surface protein bspA-like [Ditylenchus destructor]|nr:putative surface protein bspA-like [Ditylenchus destructor]
MRILIVTLFVSLFFADISLARNRFRFDDKDTREDSWPQGFQFDDEGEIAEQIPPHHPQFDSADAESRPGRPSHHHPHLPDSRPEFDEDSQPFEPQPHHRPRFDEENKSDESQRPRSPHPPGPPPPGPHPCPPFPPGPHPGPPGPHPGPPGPHPGPPGPHPGPPGPHPGPPGPHPGPPGPHPGPHPGPPGPHPGPPGPHPGPPGPHPGPPGPHPGPPGPHPGPPGPYPGPRPRPEPPSRRRHCPRPCPPPRPFRFLRDLNQGNLTIYLHIRFNTTMTKAQTKSAIEDWLKTVSKEAQTDYAIWQGNLTQWKLEFDDRVKANLSIAATQLYNEIQSIVEDEDLTPPETCHEIADTVLNSTIRSWTNLDHAIHKAMCNCRPRKEREEESREMQPMLDHTQEATHEPAMIPVGLSTCELFMGPPNEFEPEFENRSKMFHEGFSQEHDFADVSRDDE